MEQFGLFPNPAEGYFKVYLNHAEEDPATNQVRDLQGRLILTSTSNEAVKVF